MTLPASRSVTLFPNYSCVSAERPARETRNITARLRGAEHRDLRSSASAPSLVCAESPAPRCVRYCELRFLQCVICQGIFSVLKKLRDGLVLALGDIGGKGLAAGMWVTHLIGLIRTHTAASSDPEAIVAGVNRDIARLSSVEPLSTLFVARLIEVRTARLHVVPDIRRHCCCAQMDDSNCFPMVDQC